MENYFQKLNNINVNEHTEKKNGLTYLSWAWAWAEVKKLFPNSVYTVYQNSELGGMPYFTDGHTCFVKTGVTIEGIEHIEFLPVMDFKNKSIPLENVTSFDVNKAIQRSLTKAVARHGLGLYIYAGEDLPEEDSAKEVKPKTHPSGKKEEDASGVPIDSIMDILRKRGISDEFVMELYGVSSIDKFTTVQKDNILKNVNNIVAKWEEKNK